MHTYKPLRAVHLPWVRVRCLQAVKPTYRELEALLRATEGSNSGLTWVQRLQSEFAFNKKSLEQ